MISITGTSSQTLFQEINLKSLKLRDWLRKLFILQNISSKISLVPFSADPTKQ